MTFLNISTKMSTKDLEFKAEASFVLCYNLAIAPFQAFQRLFFLMVEKHQS